MSDHLPFDSDQALTEALVKVYAIRLARAWNAGNGAEVARIIEYIKGNYGENALGDLCKLSSMYACAE